MIFREYDKKINGGTTDENHAQILSYCNNIEIAPIGFGGNHDITLQELDAGIFHCGAPEVDESSRLSVTNPCPNGPARDPFLALPSICVPPKCG